MSGALVGAVNCGGDDEQESALQSTNGESATSGTTPTSSASASASASGGDDCVAMGGICDCAGGCQAGYELAPHLDGSCPQPPDEAGACSQSCCLPVDGTSGSATDSGSDSGAASSSDTGAPQYCTCKVGDELPACPDAANCGGQIGEQCCDSMGRLNECTENDIGVVWLTQFC